MRQNKKQRIPVILTFILLIVAVFGGALAIYAYNPRSADKSEAPQVTVASVAQKIIETNQKLPKSAVVDAETKGVRIPEVRLALPPYPAGISAIRYNHNAAPDGSGDGVIMTSSEAINKVLDQVSNTVTQTPPKTALASEEAMSQFILQKVPQLEACTSTYSIGFGESVQPYHTNSELVDQRVLADGRQMTIYRAKDCTLQPAGMDEYIKQMQGY